MAMFEKVESIDDRELRCFSDNKEILQPIARSMVDFDRKPQKMVTEIYQVISLFGSLSTVENKLFIIFFSMFSLTLEDVLEFIISFEFFLSLPSPSSNHHFNVKCERAWYDVFFYSWLKEHCSSIPLRPVRMPFGLEWKWKAAEIPRKCLFSIPASLAQQFCATLIWQQAVVVAENKIESESDFHDNMSSCDVETRLCRIE